MPNTRRRKFSVQNEIRTNSNSRNRIQNSHHDIEKKTSTQNCSTLRVQEKKNSNSSTLSLSKHNVIPQVSATSYPNLEKRNESVDRDVMVTTSNINLYLNDDNLVLSKDNTAPYTKDGFVKNRQSRINDRDKKQRNDKRPHIIKVRSPKRKASVLGQNNHSKKSISICTTDLELINIKTSSTEIQCNKAEEKQDLDEFNDTVVETERQLQEVSSEDMCRICHGGESLFIEFGQMISACSCRGTIGRVHIKCLERWLTESGKSRCELCSTRYSTRRVHRYGVIKAFVMWILSQNAKQLMVDGLGIILMSPLAVLAAWLSGRTLAGLMTPDNIDAPWPLASTFVLACMTLVCYYCWIVSATTRHALSWWLWYRSQYEVKLQLDEIDE